MKPPIDIRPLSRALKTLQAEQGPVARRNARKRVRTAITALLDELDASFPVPPRKAPKRTGKLDHATKMRRFKAQGFVPVSTADAALIMSCGSQVEQYGGGWYARDWAIHWLKNGGPSKLTEAVKNPAMIKAGKAAYTLGGAK